MTRPINFDNIFVVDAENLPFVTSDLLSFETADVDLPDFVMERYFIFIFINKFQTQLMFMAFQHSC